MTNQRRVIIESPYAGKGETFEEREADRKRNEAYLRACIRDSINRDEAPFASHRMYTDALDDTIAEERAAGIDAGFAWREVADATVVYNDLGVSYGMEMGIRAAHVSGHPIEFRQLRGAWSDVPERAPDVLVEEEMIAFEIAHHCRNAAQRSMVFLDAELHSRPAVLSLVRDMLDDDHAFRHLEEHLPNEDDLAADAGGLSALSTGEPALDDSESLSREPHDPPLICATCTNGIVDGEVYRKDADGSVHCSACSFEHPRSGNYDAGSVGESIPPGVGEGNKRRGLPGT